MLRFAALLLTVLTGFSGLVYEITWEKYLATLLGSHSEATAAVLGLFLGGLSIGYWLFGVVTGRVLERARDLGRPARLLVLYGCLEAGIGVYALLFPTLFSGVQALSTVVPLGSGVAGFAFDVLLSALLVLPAAVLMGGTIPILTQALSTGLDDATRFHAAVYGFNTAGAFGGALSAGFWLVPNLGLVGTLVAMSVVNLAAGAIFVAIGLRAPGEPVAPEPEAKEGAAPVPGFGVYVAIALLCGFAMMTLQTVVIRLGGLSFGASQFTFSMVVAVFVLCIAIGSALVSALSRIPRLVLVFNLWALFLSFALLYGQLDAAPYWAHRLRILFGTDPADFYPYYLAAFASLAACLIVPVTLSGATLPLVFHHMRSQVGSLGNVAGALYSWNTVGSFLGALLGGYALFFWLDLHEVYRVAVAALALAAAAGTAQVTKLPKATAAGLGTAALAGVALLPPWSGERLSAGLFREREAQPSGLDGPDTYFASRPPAPFLFYEDGPAATIAVREFPRDDGLVDRSIFSNGKSDGSVVHDYTTMAMAGLLPALLADRVDRAFIVGFGTGITAGEIAALESAPEVIVAEISPAVRMAAPLFDYANMDVSNHPRVRVIESDAYRALLRSEGTFDVVASEPSNPWVTGVEMLFSREFLEVARDRLAPGGVYAQWFHSYETDPATIEIVLRTYASVFDHVSVWYAQGSDLLLLGFRDLETASDLDRIERRFARPDLAAGFRRCGIEDLPTLLAHELLPLGVVHATLAPGPVHTLLHPRLSYLAARAFFAGGEGWLPSIAHAEPARIAQEGSLFQAWLARAGGRLGRGQHARLVRDACRHRPNECLALLGQWAHEAPNAKRRRRIQDEIVERTLAQHAGKAPEVAFDENVLAVAELYGGDGAGPAATGRVALARADRATRIFEEHYYHVAPFSREALDRFWRDCEAIDSVGDECRRRRALAEERLGRFAGS